MAGEITRDALVEELGRRFIFPVIEKEGQGSERGEGGPGCRGEGVTPSS